MHSNLTKSLAARLGGRVKVGLLAERDDTVALALARVVEGGGVEDGAVVPDGQVVLVPLEAHLQVVVVGDELEDWSSAHYSYLIYGDLGAYSML